LDWTTETGRKICKERLLYVYHDKLSVTILWGDVAFPYQEMEGKIDIALKQDFCPVLVMERERKKSKSSILQEL
jgi:hypothetical protein